MTLCSRTFRRASAVNNLVVLMYTIVGIVAAVVFGVSADNEIVALTTASLLAALHAFFLVSWWCGARCWCPFWVLVLHGGGLALSVAGLIFELLPFVSDNFARVVIGLVDSVAVVCYVFDLLRAGVRDLHTSIRPFLRDSRSPTTSNRRGTSANQGRKSRQGRQANSAKGTTDSLLTN